MICDRLKPKSDCSVRQNRSTRGRIKRDRIQKTSVSELMPHPVWDIDYCVGKFRKNVYFKIFLWQPFQRRNNRKNAEFHDEQACTEIKVQLQRVNCSLSLLFRVITFIQTIAKLEFIKEAGRLLALCKNICVWGGWIMQLVRLSCSRFFPLPDILKFPSPTYLAWNLD
jgi:hypothetical protein